MVISDRNKSYQPSDSIEIQIARLSFIAATIVTLGDVLAALAAGFTKSPNSYPFQFLRTITA